MRYRTGSFKKVKVNTKLGTVEFLKWSKDLEIMHDLLRGGINSCFLPKKDLRLQKNLRQTDNETYIADYLKTGIFTKYNITKEELNIFLETLPDSEWFEPDYIEITFHLLQKHPKLFPFSFAIASGLELLYFTRSFWDENFVLDLNLVNFRMDVEGEIYWFDPIFSSKVVKPHGEYQRYF